MTSLPKGWDAHTHILKHGGLDISRTNVEMQIKNDAAEFVRICEEGEKKRMELQVRKLTDVDLLQEICSDMIGVKSNMSLERIYRLEHSPIRSQMFLIKGTNIPTFVSVHCVRHKFGVEHFVTSNRKDRGGDEEASRNSPVSHTILVNAQAIINMAKERLCMQASKETQRFFHLLQQELRNVDPSLADCMMPKCVYRGGMCFEDKPRGKLEYNWRTYSHKLKPTDSIFLT